MKLKVTKVCCNPKFVVRPGVREVPDDVAKALFEREAAEPTDFEGKELQSRVRKVRADAEAKAQAKAEADAKAEAEAKLEADARALAKVVESAALVPSENAAKPSPAPKK